MDTPATSSAIRSARPLAARVTRLLAPVAIAFASGATAEELIATGATWSYLDDGSDQGTRWRDTDFDDSGWESGDAQLGFGDGDETTTLEQGHITYYFRHEITIDDPGEIPGLELSVLRDDGAVVYLNGNEVYRTNMPRGTIGYLTPASVTAESNAFVEFSFAPDHLVAGKNVVAVEVHQISLLSSDVSFDFSLETTATAPGDIVALGTTWSYVDDGSDLGTAWRAAEFDDSAWRTGPAELGFGDGDETTVIIRGALTYYFRHDFDIDVVDSIAALQLDIRRDDGAIVYLNGTEVVRSNMPAGEVSLHDLGVECQRRRYRTPPIRGPGGFARGGRERPGRGSPPGEFLQFGSEFRPAGDPDRGGRIANPRTRSVPATGHTVVDGRPLAHGWLHQHEAVVRNRSRRVGHDHRKRQAGIGTRSGDHRPRQRHEVLLRGGELNDRLRRQRCRSLLQDLAAGGFQGSDKNLGDRRFRAVRRGQRRLPGRHVGHGRVPQVDGGERQPTGRHHPHARRQRLQRRHGRRVHQGAVRIVRKSAPQPRSLAGSRQPRVRRFRFAFPVGAVLRGIHATQGGRSRRRRKRDRGLLFVRLRKRPFRGPGLPRH